jgi:HK97 family phage major capsid protein
MKKELRELLESIQNKKSEARALVEGGKPSEAKAMLQEIKDLQDRFDVESALEEEEKGGVKVENKKTTVVENTAVEAFKNFVTRKPMTEEMRNALQEGTSADGGVLVPAELIGTILEAKKQLVSLKNFVQVIPVTAPSGSVPVAISNTDTLVDFSELTDIAEGSPQFRSVSFAVKNKGMITPVSNLLLRDTNGIPAIVAKDFARKAVRSENADIIAAAKDGKTAKSLTNIASLKKSINKDIDPAAAAGGVIIMNQDAYDVFDNEVDSNGRPLLATSVADTNVKYFKGLQVVVLSNAELPTNAGKAPLFYGSLNGVLFFDPSQYEVAVSDHAGFRQMSTLMRVTERYDVKGGTTEDFVYGELTIA